MLTLLLIDYPDGAQASGLSHKSRLCFEASRI